LKAVRPKTRSVEGLSVGNVARGRTCQLSLGNFNGLNRIVNYKNCMHTEWINFDEIWYWDKNTSYSKD